MNAAYFITGTDTGVGKTFVTVSLASTLKKIGMDVGVMKPVETGCTGNNGGLIPADAIALMEASGTDDSLDLVNPYRFSPPVAPNIAARVEGIGIDFAAIKDALATIIKRHDVTLVEGAGGLMAPVTDDKTMAELVVHLALPLIIVADSKLGVINHTLLTVEAARSRGLAIKGIVVNNTTPPDGDVSCEYNAVEIERLTQIPVLAEIPYSDKSTPFEFEGSVLNIL